MILSKKIQIEEPVFDCLKKSRSHSEELATCIAHGICSIKVKFPMLEYAAKLIYQNIPEKELFSFCSNLQSYKTEGGNVITGKILQFMLSKNPEESLQHTVKFLSAADVWYVSDIIGERVFGEGLIQMPDTMIEYVKTLSSHQSPWVVRACGAGMHYAIKKGIKQPYLFQFAEIILHHKLEKNIQIRQGMGWAAKTLAKFHPEIIKQALPKLDLESAWLIKKIKTGLMRYEYVKGN